MELICKDEAYAIIGACFEVYNEVGYGFGEPIYQEFAGQRTLWELYRPSRLRARRNPPILVTAGH